MRPCVCLWIPQLSPEQKQQRQAGRRWRRLLAMRRTARRSSQRQRCPRACEPAALAASTQRGGWRWTSGSSLGWGLPSAWQQLCHRLERQVCARQPRARMGFDAPASQPAHPAAAAQCSQSRRMGRGSHAMSGSVARTGAPALRLPHTPGRACRALLLRLLLMLLRLRGNNCRRLDPGAVQHQDPGHHHHIRAVRHRWAAAACRLTAASALGHREWRHLLCLACGGHLRCAAGPPRPAALHGLMRRLVPPPCRPENPCPADGSWPAAHARAHSRHQPGGGAAHWLRGGPGGGGGGGHSSSQPHAWLWMWSKQAWQDCRAGQAACSIPQRAAAKQAQCTSALPAAQGLWHAGTIDTNLVNGFVILAVGLAMLLSVAPVAPLALSTPPAPQISVNTPPATLVTSHAWVLAMWRS